MLITKQDKNHNYHTLKFNEFVNELESYHKKKQNRINLNFRLLNQENIYCNEFTYFRRLI